MLKIFQMNVLLQFNITLNIVNSMLWIWYARGCRSWCVSLLLEIGCPTRVVDLALQFFYHRLAERRRRFLYGMLSAIERTASFYCKWGKRKLENQLVVQVSFFFFKALSQNDQKRALHSSCLSVSLSTWNNSSPTGGTFHEIWHMDDFRKCVENVNFRFNM